MLGRSKWVRGGLFALMLAVGCGSSSESTSGPVTAPAPTMAGVGPAAPTKPDAVLTPPDNTGWEQIRDENGIVVLRQEVEGSPLVAFRGIGVIDAPIARIGLVLIDVDHNREWVDRMKEGRALKHYSDTEHLTYSHIGAPPLVSDRDFVNHNKITFEAPDHIHIDIHSVEDPLGPPTAGVRGKLLHSSFDLRSINDNKTRMIAEIHVDPMGSLPKFVVNMVQKDWAFKTITGLRGQVTKGGIVEHAPEVRDLLGRNGFTVQ